MNKTIEFVGEAICIIAILICITIIIIIKDERKTQIKILEQSLNEQIEEKQVYMNMLKEREEILNKMKNKYKLALFMVIRNSMVMPQGIKLGKTDKEINKMSYETMCSVLTMIDYNKAEKIYEEGKSERK